MAKSHCNLVYDIDFFLGKARKHQKLAKRAFAKGDACELTWHLSLIANAIEEAAMCFKYLPLIII